MGCTAIALHSKGRQFLTVNPDSQPVSRVLMLTLNMQDTQITDRHQAFKGRSLCVHNICNPNHAHRDHASA